MKTEYRKQIKIVYLHYMNTPHPTSLILENGIVMK